MKSMGSRDSNGRQSMWQAGLFCVVAAVVDASVMSLENQDAARELQARVDAAVEDGAEEVLVPPGDYYFGNRTFLVANATDTV